MQGPQRKMLPDGRLYLHHGPVDLIIEAWGRDRRKAYQQAAHRFETILTELVGELDLLRCPVSAVLPNGRVARQMVQNVSHHTGVFITPMAAVAGAVADEICRAMCANLVLDKAYVNNGGDIALYLESGQSLTAAMPGGGQVARAVIAFSDHIRGIATSGWRGRSQSFGIADAVTVLAETSAAADAAATLIANAVDLPGHPAIVRQPACDLHPDSDLGMRPVTTDVGPLDHEDCQTALARGERAVRKMLDKNLIKAAALSLQGNCRYVGHRFHSATGILTGDRDVQFSTA